MAEKKWQKIEAPPPIWFMPELSGTVQGILTDRQESTGRDGKERVIYEMRCTAECHGQIKNPDDTTAMVTVPVGGKLLIGERNAMRFLKDHIGEEIRLTATGKEKVDWAPQPVWTFEIESAGKVDDNIPF